MKKLLLTNIAALFLTGTAHAQTVQETKAAKSKPLIGHPQVSRHDLWEPPQGNRGGPSTSIEDNRKRLIWTFRPPPEYDKPFGGALIVRQLSDEEIRDSCLLGSIACTDRITFNDGVIVCVVRLPTDDSAKKRGLDLKEIYRHEIGHCNGWPADHGGTDWKQEAAQ